MPIVLLPPRARFQRPPLLRARGRCLRVRKGARRPCLFFPALRSARPRSCDANVFFDATRRTCVETPLWRSLFLKKPFLPDSILFFFFCGWTPRYHGIPGNMLPVIFKHSVLTFIFTMAVVAILIALEDRIERHAARTRLTMDFLPNFNLQGRDIFACLLAVLLLNKL